MNRWFMLLAIAAIAPNAVAEPCEDFAAAVCAAKKTTPAQRDAALDKAPEKSQKAAEPSGGAVPADAPTVQPRCEAVDDALRKLALEPSECALGLKDPAFFAEMLPLAKEPVAPCEKLPAFWCARQRSDREGCEATLKGVIARAAPLDWHCTRIFWRAAELAERGEQLLFVEYRKGLAWQLREQLRGAKFAEAHLHLRKLADAASVYFEEEHTLDSQGTTVQNILPASAGPFPAGKACELPGKRFAPANWSAAPGAKTWDALSFSISDPHLFRYSVETSGKGADAKFAARAEADPDCDGHPMMIELRARVVDGKLKRTMAAWKRPPGCLPGQVRVPGPIGANGKSQDFCLDKTEVTVAAYKACVSAGRCPQTRAHTANCNLRQPNREDHPMNCVDWHEAFEYCYQAGGGLPLAREMLWAAQGGTQARPYPWGKDAPAAQVCWSGKGNGLAADAKRTSTCPAGSLAAGASRDGLLDLSGNVWEWTDTRHRGSEDERVVLGGGFGETDPELVGTDMQSRQREGTRAAFIGFRCAKTP